MSLFDRFKKKKPVVDWRGAYIADPKFYGKSNGELFGTITLTEGTRTILPRSPQEKYTVDGKIVLDWRMVLVSTSTQRVMGDIDYLTALRKIKAYTLDAEGESILVRELSLQELESLK